MKNWKCKIGVHNYETIGSQNAKGLVGGFSMTPLMREIKRCKRCDKIIYFNQLTVKNGIYCFKYKKENMITPT